MRALEVHQKPKMLRALLWMQGNGLVMVFGTWKEALLDRGRPRPNGNSLPLINQADP